MEDLVIKQIEEILYRISYAEYNSHYSSQDHDYEIQLLEHMLAPLLTLAKSLNINLTLIKSSYCDNCVCAEDYYDMETKLKYL